MVEVLVLLAQAYRAAGNEEKALNAIFQALFRAGLEGYVRTFANEGRSLAALLHQVAAIGSAAQNALEQLPRNSAWPGACC